MRSFNEIYQEVYQESSDDLKSLKEKNRGRNLLFIILIAILIIFAFIYESFLFGIIGGIIGIFFIFGFSKQFGEYKLQYKEKVIKKFIKGYSDTLDYYPARGLSSHEYDMAGFDGYYDRYHSEDLIQGTILDDCNIAMAEVHTEREETTTDSDGNTTTSYVTIFHGLFASIELKTLNTLSFKILKNTLLSGVFKGKKRLEMDSDEFEKIYDVSTDDKISTLRVLTSDVMQILIDFKKQNKITPEIILRNNKLYIRFAVGNVFEPNMIKKDMDFDKLKKTYDMLKFTLNLAQEFSKNILEFEE